MKKTTTMNKDSARCGCTVRHKVWAAIALVGLFACGLFVGMSLNKCRAPMPRHAQHVAQHEQPRVAADKPYQKPACEIIENILKERLFPETSTAAGAHFDNAEIYTRLVDKGCAEHADYFKAQALREIEIATALQPTEALGEYETEIVIDAYKKSDMQREAKVFLDKVQRLTDPAIDFILKMEKVINE